MPRKQQKPMAPQDQGYGVRGEQLAAQRAMPLPDNRSNVVALPGAGAPPAPARDPAEALAAAMAAAQGMAPPTGGLDAPTERPTEPLTAGLPMGAGPGPSPGALPPPPEMDKVAEVLRAAFAAFGTDEIAALLERATGGR